MLTSSMLQGHIGLLLQQQLLGQLANMDGGLSLTEALLQRQRKSGREISAEAITGRLRSDVGSLRQTARNLREGGAIAEIAKVGTSSIAESLEKMQKLAQSITSTSTAAEITAANTAYNDLAAGIQSVISNTTYNGISLMNGSRWAADPDGRVTPTGDGITGTIGIQAGRGVRTLTLTDFSNNADLNTVLTKDALSTAVNAPPPANPTDPTALDTLITNLSTQLKTMQMYEKSYGQIASSMESEAKNVERQSRIMDLTATRTIAGAGTDPASKLLFFLLSDQGKLIDNKG